MRNYWRTKSGLARLRLAFRKFLRLFAEDFYATIRTSKVAGLFNLPGLFKALAERHRIVPRYRLPDQAAPASPRSPARRPVIFVSAAADATRHGGERFCGGTKELNYLVKLLRSRGYDACMVTYDGHYEPWQIEHQPYISLAEFRAKIKTCGDVRCVTSLVGATGFIRDCPRLYFWDMELASTDNFHFVELARLYRRKIRRVAGISRTIQAWHMAHFETHCILLPPLLDNTIWSPAGEKVAGRVGYMNEGAHTAEYIGRIQALTQAEGLPLEFRLISGVESEVLAGMRSCDVFLGMNPGKDSLWGEGSPITAIEALATDCVVVAFDVLGNRETLIHNFNSLLVPRHRPDLMAEALAGLYRQPGRIGQMRTNARTLIQSCHALSAQWPTVREFLELDD